MQCDILHGVQSLSMKFLSLIFIGSLGLANAWANSPEEGVVVMDCPSTVFRSIQVKNYPAFPAQKCGFQKEAEFLFLTVQDLAGRALPPPALVILNDSYAFGGGYDAKTDVLELKITQATPSFQWQPSLVHELGHAVMNQRLKERYPDLSSLPDSIDFRRAFKGVNELFADIVAVLVYNDPEIMVTATATPTFDNAFLSFSHETALTEKMTVDEHSQLAPLRFPLWKQWIKPGASNPPLLLRQLEDILIDDVYANFRQDLSLNLYERPKARVARLATAFGFSVQP